MTEPGKHRAAHRAERGGRSRSLLWLAVAAALVLILSTAFSISRLDSDDDASGGSEASGTSGAAGADAGGLVAVAGDDT